MFHIFHDGYLTVKAINAVERLVIKQMNIEESNI